MKVRSKAEKKSLDMTPMIDITFLLISFFMMVVNFSEEDQNQRIRLPSSELARPTETVPVNRITLQVTDKGTVIYGPNELDLEQLKEELAREKRFSVALGTKFMESTIIIRADARCETGKVQDVILLCQELGLDKFNLRAKQEVAQ